MVSGKVCTNIGKEIIAWTRTSGKSLLSSKPIKVSDVGLKYTPELKADTFVKKVENWFDCPGHVTPYAKEGKTQVEGHHDFNGGAFHGTVEEFTRSYMERKPNASKESLEKAVVRTKETITLCNIDAINDNRKFLKLEPQPYDSVAFRGRTRRIGEQLGSDFDIIEKAKVGDEIVPTGSNAYAAHHKFDIYQYMGSGLDFRGNKIFEPMMIEYRIPKGAQVSSNMEHGGEVVFPAFSKYKLVSKETRQISRLNRAGKPVASYPYKHVILEYIPEIPLLSKGTRDMTENEYKFLFTKAMKCKNWAEFVDLACGMKDFGPATP